MNKKFNLIIDGFMSILIGLLAGGGFLVYYVLIPGQEVKSKYGPFIELSFWGMDRHEWATIHLIISFIFLTTVALHIFLHWKMICNICKQVFRKPSRHLWSIWGIILLSTTIAVLPFFATPNINSKAPNSYGRMWKTELNKETSSRSYKVSKSEKLPKRIDKKGNPAKNKQTKQAISKDIEEQIKGSQTLNSACKELGIDAGALCKKLNIPTYEKDEQLGRIKRKYNLKMDSVKRIMIEMRDQK